MPTHQFTWVNSISREQAGSIPQKTWDKYREIIQEKYDRIILTDLIIEMEAEFGFIATYVYPRTMLPIKGAGLTKSDRKSQYNHQFKRWGFAKRHGRELL